MSKKDFSGVKNTALAFISEETIERAEEEEKPARTQKRAHRKRKETKTRRVQILVQPSVYEAIQKKAEREGTSVNEAIIQAIKKYTK